MRKSFLVPAVAAAALLSAFGAQAQTGFEDHLIAQQDYVWRTIVYTQSNRMKLETTAPSLRPVPDDIIVFPADLNGDGKDDFVATIKNFMYQKNGTFPLYVMIADKYGYTQIQAEPGIASFDIKALNTSHSGLKDFIAAGRTYVYDGKSYKAK